jgi:hypothetical protein
VDFIERRAQFSDAGVRSFSCPERPECTEKQGR